MMVLKCDKCKKITDVVQRMSIEWVSYSIGDEKHNALLQPSHSRTIELCHDCFLKVSKLFMPTFGGEKQ